MGEPQKQTPPPSATSSPAFDLDGAKKAGYSDDEIAQHLAKSRNFDYAGATKAGYSPQEIIQHLNSQAPSPSRTPAPTPTGTPEGNKEPASKSTPAAPSKFDTFMGWWNWFSGAEEGGFSDKGLIKTGIRKIGEIGKTSSEQRQRYRESQQFYNTVQKNYNDSIARINSSKESESTKAWLRKRVQEERDARLSGSDTFIEQLAPNMLQTTSKIAEGMTSPQNAALGAAATLIPQARPIIGIGLAAQGLYEALKPRNDDPKDPDFESQADYLERVLMGGSQAAGGAALAKAPHRTTAGERRYRLNKATFAAGGANQEFSAALGDIDETLRTSKTKVKTVEDVQTVVQDTERRLNQHFEQALFPIRGNKLVPTQISDALMTKANEPNLQKTPEGRAESRAYQRAAVNFQQEWSLGDLDLERRRLFDARLARKGSVDQSISRRASTSLNIDQIIEDQIRDLEYGELNRRYPNQNFADLKFRQSQLVELKRQLQKRVDALKNKQGIEKGGPLLSGEHAIGSVSKHGLMGRVYAKFPGQGPETQANTAAKKAFKRPGPGTQLAPLGQPQQPPTRMTPPPIAARVPEDVVASVFGHDSVERFYDLKKQWSETNNNLLKYVNEPNSPEARAAIDKMQAISAQINAMNVNAGVGTPGPIRDVVIVGAGPGGMAAATMAAAEGLNVTFIDAQATAGGQAKFSSRIENYPGFPAGIPGEDLTRQMFEQATRLGAEAQLGQRVTKLEHDPKGNLKTLTLANGQKVQARTVIVAGGVEFRKLNFPGAETAKNVFYGDGKSLTQAGAGKSVVVLGGSNGAAQAALGAATKAEHVYVISRSPITKGMSDYQVQALHASKNITVIEGDEIAGLKGNQLSTKSGKTLPADAVGVFLGSAPETSWLPEQVTRRGGKIVVNSDLMTPVSGVFAIGDIRENSIGRVGMAVGDGQMAVRNLFPYLQENFPKPVTAKETPTVHQPRPFEAEEFKKKSRMSPAAKAAAVARAATAGSSEEGQGGPEQ